jgi:hypothetical protein
LDSNPTKIGESQYFLSVYCPKLSLFFTVLEEFYFGSKFGWLKKNIFCQMAEPDKIYLILPTSER